MPTNECPLCGNFKLQFVGTDVAEDEEGREHLADVYRCFACDYEFYLFAWDYDEEGRDDNG